MGAQKCAVVLLMLTIRFKITLCQGIKPIIQDVAVNSGGCFLGELNIFDLETVQNPNINPITVDSKVLARAR